MPKVVPKGALRRTKKCVFCAKLIRMPASALVTSKGSVHPKCVGPWVASLIERLQKDYQRWAKKHGGIPKHRGVIDGALELRPSPPV